MLAKILRKHVALGMLQHFLSFAIRADLRLIFNDEEEASSVQCDVL